MNRSGDDRPVSPQATKALQQWPTVEVVAPPPWLPEGWTTVVRTQECGRKQKYYVDPGTERRFYGKTEVFCILETGKRWKWEPKSALLEHKKRPGSATRKSHQEQLQKLGREFCLQAVKALRGENGGRTTLQHRNMGLRSSVAHELNGSYNSTFNSKFNPAYDPSVLHKQSGENQHEQDYSMNQSKRCARGRVQRQKKNLMPPNELDH